MFKGKHDTAHWIAGICALACLLCLVLSQASAFAGTTYVDGVSDQNLQNWGAPFTTWFANTWVNGSNGHIRFARYAPRWNAVTSQRSTLEAWINNASGMGLKLDIAPTVYHERKPSPSEYRTELTAMLNLAEGMGHRIEFVEPWNEPNGQGKRRRRKRLTTPMKLLPLAPAGARR